MKLKIAICDDEAIFLNDVAAYIRSAIEKTNQTCEIIPCTSGHELVQLCAGSFVDAVFLDIAMPGIDGFETAKRLLELQKKTLIVFVSSKETMVFSSYEFQPFWFVPKSNMPLLETVAERAVQKMIANRQTVLSKPIKLENQMVEVDFKEVAYIRNDEHYVTLVYKDGKTSCGYREKLDVVEESLKGHWFLRCHSRFLVNCRMIRTIEASSCTLVNDEQIPISRARIGDTKKIFQDYLRSIR